MTKTTDKKTRQKIRKRRSDTIKGTKERPRAVLNGSNRYFRVQAIDDISGRTILAASTQDFTKEEVEKLGQQTKVELEEWKKEFNSKSRSRKNKIYAWMLGKLFAEKLEKVGIKKVVFDRNGRPYHGNMEVFCQAMRELGINF